jgi:GAF domain-containing protein
VTNSGAQRGCLVLEHGGKLLVEAMSTPEQGVRTKLGVPVEQSTDLAGSVIQYVARTRETVVLGDASGRNRFASDRYIVSQKPKSLLCLALLHQGRLVGVLYLENNLAADVFTENRVELIRLLSSHAAVSVQNAQLYSEVKSMSEQLRAANKELVETNAQLQSELVERARAEQERILAEQERVALQQEIIQVQNVRLAELSTPLIPIHDQIMVMPIIGTVDGQRAQQVVEAALTGAQQHRTAILIIDITGMKHIDTNVARTLMQAASSLRLLGTQAVLTGIRSEVAQTLVRLGIDLNGIVTLSNLQSGIAYALSQTARSPSGRAVSSQQLASRPIKGL